MNVSLRHGDCLAILREMPDASVDALVTDPPAGIEFMGKAWDHDHGGRQGWVAAFSAIFRECLRVMKPGAHGLVWAIPRTSHWTATALEDAGFEVRDVITHHFGSGFPKSLDVSKAIDKAAGAEREVVGSKLGQPGYSATRAKDESGYEGGWTNPEKECAVTAPATDAAKQWQGWGTTLKPASEHWILVRKPLSEPNVAANVLAHGTGAINVDGCRVACSSKTKFPTGYSKATGGTYAQDDYSKTWTSGEDKNPSGRWPANLVLSHAEGCNGDCAPGCPVAELDLQSGVLTSGSRAAGTRHIGLGHHGAEGDGGPAVVGDSGGASRFFYVAKAATAERNKGLTVTYVNRHPTVKPVDLMRWLCRLVTPKDGIVLDPFMGSGSTGVAAKLEGFGFTGIEQDQESFEVARRRLDWATYEPELF